MHARTVLHPYLKLRKTWSGILLVNQRFRPQVMSHVDRRYHQKADWAQENNYNAESNASGTKQ
jgi:hypothetical protein